ncbi:MAG: DUF6152 family protein [Steroidobacteraceae bacterium]
MNAIKRGFGMGAVVMAAALLATMLPAYAHHSTSGFDSSVVVAIEGTVTQFRWINPHASIKVNGKASVDGKASAGFPNGVWTVEMTAPNVLVNSGWKRTSLKVGDKVTIFVNPLRNAYDMKDHSQGGLYVGAILKSGEKLGRTDGKGAGSAR